MAKNIIVLLVIVVLIAYIVCDFFRERYRGLGVGHGNGYGVN